METMVTAKSGGAEDRTLDPWIQEEKFIHYTTVAPQNLDIYSANPLLSLKNIKYALDSI